MINPFKPKSTIELFKKGFFTGNYSEYVAAVWEETQNMINLAISLPDNELFLGQMAGFAFARREMVYDEKLFNKGQN